MMIMATEILQFTPNSTSNPFLHGKNAIPFRRPIHTKRPRTGTMEMISTLRCCSYHDDQYGFSQGGSTSPFGPTGSWEGKGTLPMISSVLAGKGGVEGAEGGVLLSPPRDGVELPVSLRIVKMKQRLARRLGKVRELTELDCSIRRALSSLVELMEDLHSFIIKTAECGAVAADVHETLSTAKMEMTASFLSVFVRVFSATPSLMLQVMDLVGDFTAYSVATINDAQPVVVEGSPSPSEVVTDKDMVELKDRIQRMKQPDVSRFRELGGGLGSLGVLGSFLQEMPELPTGMLNERQVDEKVQAEAARLELYYEFQIAKEPNNSLLLSNYAQFLYFVARDHDKAELYFKRSVVAEPRDGEAITRYAKFLWHLRHDMGRAEEVFVDGIDAGLANSHHIASYSNFLWQTGGEGICCPPTDAGAAGINVTENVV